MNKAREFFFGNEWISFGKNCSDKQKGASSNCSRKFRRNEELEKYEKTSRWVNINFEEHNKTQKTKHFAFSFKTNNLNDLLCFSVHLIDSENKEIEFVIGEKRISILNFIIEILK